MKAVRIHEYGGPEVLTYEEAPVPELQPDEVLVRVHAVGVNPFDWKVREGQAKEYLKHALPLTPGWDVSGTIEAVGPDVRQLKPGDDVCGLLDINRNGAYAEYAALRESSAALKPESLDHVHAAAIPLAGLAAWQALLHAGVLRAGQRVLIHGAAGGVGSFAVQLAKWKRAYVIGTASARNHAFLHSLGADEVLDYASTCFENSVRDVDVVLDTVGGDTLSRSWGVLRRGGVLVSIVAQPPPEQAVRRGVRQAFVFVVPMVAELAALCALVDCGMLKPVVDTVFPLTQARKAHILSEAGHTRGKIVLRVR